MPELSFEVADARAVPFAAAPTLAFNLRISTAPQQQIHSIMLRCQIRIEATRRRYQDGEHQRLFDLFGPPEDWGRTLRALHWTEQSLSVPGFTGSTQVDLHVPLTYDFNVAATKYFDALTDGDVPLTLLFTGTVFHTAGPLPVQVAQIPWETEAKFRFPITTWRELMARYYPDSVWLPVPKHLVERLAAFQRRSSAPDWERALETLLEQSEAATEGTTHA